jgi:hypothetical protein
MVDSPTLKAPIPKPFSHYQSISLALGWVSSVLEYVHLFSTLFVDVEKGVHAQEHPNPNPKQTCFGFSFFTSG